MVYDALIDIQHIDYVDSKIEGLLQESVETRYLAHLEQLGVNVESIKQANSSDKYKFRGRYLKSWVAEDYRKRMRFVKSGYSEGVTNLVRSISVQHNVSMAEVRSYLPRDSIASLRTYCLDNGYHSPKYYYELDGNWSFEKPGYEEQLRNRVTRKVGIVVKIDSKPDILQESFEEEQLTPDVTMSIGMDQHGNVRAAELKASASLCEVFNIPHKSFEESPYYNFSELRQLKKKREHFKR